ncbi:hypothetical protein ILUMI_26947 [Ignelater luminosus]|uniref:Uncharacterized protein n=1 Tax=Ignelater luminosus TaxID=2038154 RepID=A0A8K0FY70_IGNLU|nr:hypothetical protein ILUMI_26947 [Ignelater luminosus]
MKNFALSELVPKNIKENYTKHMLLQSRNTLSTNPSEFWRFLNMQKDHSGIPSVMTCNNEDEDERNLDILVVKNSGHNTVRTDIDWDSEDDIPLAGFLTVPPAVTSVTCSNGLNSVIVPVQFSGTSGPNIPDCVRTPLDFFMNLFFDE